MERHKYSKWITLMVIVAAVIVTGGTIREGWTAEAKYPNRLIQVVICYQPGSTDMALRPLVDKLPEYLGQPVAFVYKPGAAGAVGASFVAKAKPDGYTLIGTSPSPVLISPLTKEELDYTLDDFVPICRFSTTPIILAARADSPWKTLKDVVEEAKKSPGKLTYSSAGVFGSTHVPVERFLKLAGINMTHVPCEGTTPAVTALLGGHVSMVSSTMAPLTPHLKSGTLRGIASFEKERLREFPNIPTFTESGYPVIYDIWYGLLAPKGTPGEVVNTIYTASKKVVENHKGFTEDRLEKMSLLLKFARPEEFNHDLRAENEVMKGVIKDLMRSTK